MYSQEPISRFSALKLFQKPVLICVNPCLFSSTIVENPRQIAPFLRKTNPISKRPSTNISTAITSTYANAQRTMNHERPCKTNPIKPSVKIGKMNATFFTIKAYANEQRAMDTEPASKQTQSNPNWPTARGTKQKSEARPRLRTERMDYGRLVLGPSSSLPG
jgi:hypothetical protein